MIVTPKEHSKHLTKGNEYELKTTDKGGNFFVCADDGNVRPYSSTTFETLTK